MPATQVAKAGVRKRGWTCEKMSGRQTVARHREPDARLAELKDQDRRDHADDRAQQNDEARPVQEVGVSLEREPLEPVDDRRGVSDDRAPRDDAGEHERDADVEDGADDQRGDDSDRHSALRVAALLAGGRDGVEADVGEEDDGAAGEHAGPAVGRERMVVARMDEVQADEDEGEDRDELDEHHDVVGACGLADAAHEDDRQKNDDEECRNVETEVPAGSVDDVAGEIGETLRQVRRREPLRAERDAEPIEQVDEVRGEADARRSCWRRRTRG